MASWNGEKPVKPSSVPYFYGRITRDEAEEILKDHGHVTGMFLLRESINPLGNYAVSLCCEGKVHHYVIEKQTDGTFMIPSGKKFIGPIELIEHHKQNKDGVITQLTTSCDRMASQMPVAFRGMTYADLERELLQKANTIKGVNKERALGAQREHLVIIVARDLHQKQPWYHGMIDRQKSEKRLRDSGHRDGKFLVRLREDKQTYAICISFRNDTRHYLIDKNRDNKYGIQDGPKFECIMMLIDHYHNKQDGLLCKLTEPCPSPGFDSNQLKKYLDCNMGNLEYFQIGQTANGFGAKRPESIRNKLGPAPPIPVNASYPPPVPSATHRPSLKEKLGFKRNNRGPLPPTPDEARGRIEGNWDDSQQGFNSQRVDLEKLGVDPEKLEGIYGTLPRTESHFALRKDQIDLQETLGSGQFGSVCRGMCTMRDGKKVPVAIKTLKQEEVNSSQEPELIKEAKIMMPLSHKHIVRMIGLCKAECIMLVLELAPLGPLNSFLQKHKETPQSNVVELLMQVAMGMEYLESMKFVHRDLAARNVLLVSEHFAKISDFGMSKAVGRDNNYYEAKEAGKWPLKWYAPECVYYWKFDTKSDVWSYGVTMWEATSYGDKPYRGMKGQEILKFLVEEDRRLEKPEFCDPEVYNVMLRCWDYEKCERPTFSELVEMMKRLYEMLSKRMYKEYIRKSLVFE